MATYRTTSVPRGRVAESLKSFSGGQWLPRSLTWSPMRPSALWHSALWRSNRSDVPCLWATEMGTMPAGMKDQYARAMGTTQPPRRRAAGPGCADKVAVVHKALFPVYAAQSGVLAKRSRRWLRRGVAAEKFAATLEPEAASQWNAATPGCAGRGLCL